MTHSSDPIKPVRPELGVANDIGTRLARVGHRFYAARGKRLVDIVLSLVLLILLSPVLLVVMLLVARDGAAPIYVQHRTGRRGQDFECLKFRSMVPDADAMLHRLLAQDPAAAAEWRRTQKLENDPRVTRIGRFLRATSLDELPQLWNVLRGDMSLVGPRPVTEEELARYGAAVDTVLSVRPGMTGLWQVTGRGLGVSYADRVKMDLRYARGMTFMRDLSILFKTASVVVRGTGT